MALMGRCGAPEGEVGGELAISSGLPRQIHDGSRGDMDGIVTRNVCYDIQAPCVWDREICDKHAIAESKRRVFGGRTTLGPEIELGQCFEPYG